MSVDQRAHVRLDDLESVVKKHLQDHALFEKSLLENTQMTRQIVDNTSELVGLVKGAKGLRSFVVWGAPIVAAVLAGYAWIRGH